jgi:release factor glutamine methyltransferase
MLSHNVSARSESIAGCIEACRTRLKAVSQTPWLDARILASFVTGLDASAVVAYGDTALSAGKRRLLFALAERRAAGEPVAYIVGAKDFCGLRLAVDRRVMVPRPETEALVMAIVEQWRGAAPHIVDVGTGSGAIACALAHMLPGSRVVATDVSEDALMVARANVNALGLAERVRLVRGDLFDGIPEGETFDAMAANLPYIEDGAADSLDLAVRDEPAIALYAGCDGLAVYRRMLRAAPARLASGGALYCECGPRNSLGLAKLVKEAFPAAHVSIRKDLAGLERIVSAQLAKPAV